MVAVLRADSRLLADHQLRPKLGADVSALAAPRSSCSAGQRSPTRSVRRDLNRSRNLLPYSLRAILMVLTGSYGRVVATAAVVDVPMGDACTLFVPEACGCTGDIHDDRRRVRYEPTARTVSGRSLKEVEEERNDAAAKRAARAGRDRRNCGASAPTRDRKGRSNRIGLVIMMRRRTALHRSGLATSNRRRRRPRRSSPSPGKLRWLSPPGSSERSARPSRARRIGRLALGEASTSASAWSSSRNAPRMLRAHDHDRECDRPQAMESGHAERRFV